MNILAEGLLGPWSTVADARTTLVLSTVMNAALQADTLSMVLKILAVAAAVGVALLRPGAEYDFVFDWLVSRAFVTGISPFEPLNVLSSTFEVPHITTPWVHPRLPGAFLLQAPVGWIPYNWVYLSGRALTVASAFILAWVVARIGKFEAKYAFVAVPMLLLLWPFSTVLHYSQIGFLVAALIAMTYLLGDRWLAGIPLGVAVVMKLWPWLLIPGLWLMGRRKAAGGAIVSFITLNVIGLAFPHVSLEEALETLTAARSLESSSLVSGLPLWLIATTGLTALIIVNRLTKDVFWWAIPIALLLAPVIWTHYLPAVILVIVVVARRLSEGRTAVEAIGVEGRDVASPGSVPS